MIDLAGAAGFKTTMLVAVAQGNTEGAAWVNPREKKQHWSSASSENPAIN